MAMGPPPTVVLGAPAGPASRRHGGSDAAVMGTNDDAQVSKLSCVQRGYFSDSILPHFVRRPTRRSPLINRGYWARYAALRQLLMQFLAATCGLDRAAQPTAEPAARMQQQQQPRQHQQATVVGNQQLHPHLSAEQGSEAHSRQALQQPQSSGKQQQQQQQQQQQLHCQVVNLGAGFDTTWLQLAHQNAQVLQGVRWIELDFPEVVQRKVHTISSKPELHRLVGLKEQQTQQQQQEAKHPASPGSRMKSQAAPTGSSDGLHMQPATAVLPHTSQASPPVPTAAQGAVPTQASADLATANEPEAPHTADRPVQAVSARQASVVAGELLGSHGYSCVGADLRQLTTVEAALARAGFDNRLPTLFMCECVLVYMEPQHSAALLAWAAAAVARAGGAVVIYEQVRPDDAFGRTMVQNLEERGCPLLGLDAVPSLEAQRQRLLNAGWQHAQAWDMRQIYEKHLDTAQRAAAERCEMLDELEEWHLIQEHYCIALGCKDASSERTVIADQQGVDTKLSKALGFGVKISSILQHT